MASGTAELDRPQYHSKVNWSQGDKMGQAGGVCVLESLALIADCSLR